MMKWYTAQIVYKSVIDREPELGDTDTYEESLVLIKAESQQEAHQIAEVKGQQEQLGYKNMYNQEVRWEFVKVIDVYELLEDHVDSGTEVFSRFLLVP